jgi:hypothetical protein
VTGEWHGDKYEVMLKQVERFYAPSKEHELKPEHFILKAVPGHCKGCGGQRSQATPVAVPDKLAHSHGHQTAWQCPECSAWNPLLHDSCKHCRGDRPK